MSREQLLLVSSLERLRQRYGRAGLDELLSSVEVYRDSLRSRHIDLTTAFIDDKVSVGPFGIDPLKTITPASVKAALHRITTRLSASGDGGPKPALGTPSRSLRGNKAEASRADTSRSSRAARSPAGVESRSSSGLGISILILGGGEVIPYFRLPNPALDSDSFVFSDNPYGCPPRTVSLEKCLLPQVPVGRMPDGNGADVQLLLSQIGAASAKVVSLSGRAESFQKSAFGYTASVWKKASREVWRDIGYTGSLRICPPLSDVDVTPAWFSKKSLLYFNLHGSDAEPYWFGQGGTNFPRALSPAHVNRFCREKSVIVTEACYGAVEMSRKRETSMSLAFLSSGSICLVGSTCTAYGAFTPPVSEADLIALHFFRNVHRGMAFGRALVKARAQLAAETVSRQGYLDEDDKKTLVQFLLFGDPTITVLPLSAGSGENAKNTEDGEGIRKK